MFGFVAALLCVSNDLFILFVSFLHFSILIRLHDMTFEVVIKLQYVQHTCRRIPNTFVIFFFGRFLLLF